MKITSIMPVLVFLTAFYLFTILPVQADPKTIVVPDDYPDIFMAIENAVDGDTIFLKRGYYEGPINQTLIIDRAILIEGEGPKTTTLSLHPQWVTEIILNTPLSYYANPISIEANDVRISGLTITSDGGEISANGSRTQLTGNIFGVGVVLGGSHQLFDQNIIIGAGVTCRGYNATISNNNVHNGMIGSDSGSYDEIFGNNVTGSIAIGGTSTFEMVYGNLVRDGNDQHRAGISIAGIGITVSNNTISNCSIGISQDWGYNNNVCGNVITDNRGPALKVTGWGYNFTFVQNYVADNPVGAQIDTFTFDIYHNSFINNDLQIEILDDKIYSWWMDNSKEGNYWSDYDGKDADGDGIGDDWYVVKNEIADRFPLMTPIKNENGQILPTSTPSLTPSPVPFPATMIIAAIASVFVVGVGLLIYFKKRKR